MNNIGEEENQRFSVFHIFNVNVNINFFKPKQKQERKQSFPHNVQDFPPAYEN